MGKPTIEDLMKELTDNLPVRKNEKLSFMMGINLTIGAIKGVEIGERNNYMNSLIMQIKQELKDPKYRD